MNFENLRHFEGVAKRRSFVRAADDLHISQPALTRSIQTLERELGGRLFDRRAHKVELTGFGSFVLDRVRGMLSSQEQLSRDIGHFKGVERGNLRVGFGPLAGETIAPPSVGRFLEEHPRIHLRLAFLATDLMVKAVTTGKIDVLVGEPLMRKDEPDLVRIELKKRPGFFYCRAGHPLLNKRSPILSDLARYPFVGFKLPPRLGVLAGIGGRFVHVDPATGNLVPQVECYSVAAAKQIVAASDGIGLANRAMIWREMRDQMLTPLPLTVPGLETAYSIVTLRGRTLTPAAQAFIKIVCAIDDELDKSSSRLNAKEPAKASVTSARSKAEYRETLSGKDSRRNRQSRRAVVTDPARDDASSAAP